MPGGKFGVVGCENFKDINREKTKTRWIETSRTFQIGTSRNIVLAAVVHLNVRAGSTFPVPVCTVPTSMDRTSRCNKVDAVRLEVTFTKESGVRDILSLKLNNFNAWFLEKK